MSCPTVRKMWLESEEYKRAMFAFQALYNVRFEDTPEFRNARLAFRRRMNNSIGTETM